jgi:hypothetical protein
LGLSSIVNKALFYTGNRDERQWDYLINKYDIKTEIFDSRENAFISAKFDSRGFEEIMTHIAEGLISPECQDNTRGFSMESIGKDQFDKAEL